MKSISWEIKRKIKEIKKISKKVLTKVKKFDIIDKHSSGGQTQREEKTQI